MSVFERSWLRWSSLGLLLSGSFVLNAMARAVPESEPSDVPRIAFWSVGGGADIVARFGAPIHPIMKTLNEGDRALDRVLLAMAETPLTPAQIEQRTGLGSARVSEVVAALDSLGLVRAGDEGRCTLTVPVLTDRQEGAVRAAMAETADRVARSMRTDAEMLRHAYEESRAPTDPEWDAVAPLILDKFLVDGSFHAAIGDLEVETGVSAVYTEAQQRVAVFFLEEGDNFSSFGTNWYPFRQGQAQREIYVLHGAVFHRLTIRMNRYGDHPGFGAALFKIAREGGLGALTAAEREPFDELEWTDGGRLAVPIVSAASIRAILPIVKTAGHRAAEVMFESHDAITKAFERSPYASFLNGRGDYVQACYHTLFSLIIEKLEQAGVVPPVPSPVPERYGVYVLIGNVF